MTTDTAGKNWKHITRHIEINCWLGAALTDVSVGAGAFGKHLR
ncbi:hypothetical protein [Chitinophaga caseinilytica]|uniref:Uncharacterized protein n=1 Tax=Chitinophaga caseinilytica TaxID=2267521 RepID=A0ABZ2Z006_9BACT